MTRSNAAKNAIQDGLKTPARLVWKKLVAPESCSTWCFRNIWLWFGCASPHWSNSNLHTKAIMKEQNGPHFIENELRWKQNPKISLTHNHQLERPNANMLKHETWTNVVNQTTNPTHHMSRHNTPNLMKNDNKIHIALRSQWSNAKWIQTKASKCKQM